MLIVMMVILTSMLFGVVHQRHLIAALQIEQARMDSEAYVYGPLSVLAIAVDRLEKSKPPAPIDYRYSHTVDGDTTLYRIRYARAGNQWTVTAEPDRSAGGLPTLPASL
jgi:hypothetical protein